MYLIEFAWDKYDNLGIEDQKRVLNEIFEELGFEEALEYIVLDEEPPPKVVQHSLKDDTIEGSVQESHDEVLEE